MPTAISFGYSPDALTYDAASGSFTLDPGYTPANGRVRFEFNDDDRFLDGDRSANEVGEDGNQTAIVTTPAGVTVASGQIYAEEYAVIEAPDGTLLYIDRLEIDGQLVGYIPSEPLQPGVPYENIDTYNIDDANGDNRLTYSQYEDNSVPCFAGGTMIATPEGEMPVEWLLPGDRVITRDHGVQAALWTGLFRPSADMQSADPIRIPADTFGPNRPCRTLALSPQHHVQIDHPLADLLFAARQVHVPACHLVGWRGVTRRRADANLVYHHILLHHPQVVLADGLWCESLFLGDRARELIGIDQSRATSTGARHDRCARRRLRGWETRVLLAGIDRAAGARDLRHAA